MIPLEGQKGQFDSSSHWVQKDEYLNKLLCVSGETIFVVYTMMSDLSIKRITISVSYVCERPHMYSYPHVRKNVKNYPKNVTSSRGGGGVKKMQLIADVWSARANKH